MREERGFLLLETVLLGVFLLLMAAAFSLPRHAAQLRGASAARQTAVLLAQQELVELELLARSKKPAQAVRTGWLGPEADLRRHARPYDVAGSIEPQQGGWRLQVVVSWIAQEAQASVTLEKWVGAHDNTG